MNILQKILGAIFPPYKFSVLSREQDKFYKAILSSLPNSFEQIKDQVLSTTLRSLNDWKLYPDFKFVGSSYPGETVFNYKKNGANFKISGLQIFSKRNKQFEDVEILIQNNLICGLRITNSDYQLNEFDLNQITSKNVTKSAFDFPPGEIDIFYNSLSQDIKEKLNINDLFDIDFNNRTFYSFYDLEDGNYLAVDKNQKVYSLVHDAKPIAKALKVSFIEILDDITNQRFDIAQHLNERYRNSY